MSAVMHSDTVVWQDVECGGYTADLPLWTELADTARAPLLELGCGCGRVALHLARLGYGVSGIDNDPELVEELRRRSATAGIEVRAERADGSTFALTERFGLILAPMQVLQLLPGPARRADCLSRIAAHLRPGGMAAIALVDDFASGIPSSPPVPDVRELDGRVYSSLPLGVIDEAGELVVERLRQKVSPGGRLEDVRDSVRLQKLSAAELEEEAQAAGLRPAGRRLIEASEMHAGSTVVLLEA